MKSVVGFGLLGGALAFSSDSVGHIPQIPLLQDACPSNSILHNGECQPSTVTLQLDSPDKITFRPNISLTLDESRDSASKLEDFPWTFWPECFAPENATEAYCVFSDQKFASGRGIFIITTSSQAYAMLDKPAFSQPNALHRINDHDNPPFEQFEFPGKGRGLVANKTLHRGDQIFASTPLLITNPGMYDLSTEERLSLSYRGVESLPAKSKELFWKLLDHFKEDPVEDRINTNAFEIEINGLQAHAVLPEIAMLNHDCRPNAAYFWDEETMAHYVHATQDIYPGQEITITYINNERARDKRMQNLKANWGFDCSCSSCTQHAYLVSESDARIAQIKSLTTSLDDWTANSAATPEMAETLISLYEQERLWASLGTAYKHAAEVYSSFGDKYVAIKYARLSVEFGMLDKGFRDKDNAEMRKMAKEPEMSWSWNKRVGMRRFEGGCGHMH